MTVEESDDLSPEIIEKYRKRSQDIVNMFFKAYGHENAINPEEGRMEVSAFMFATSSLSASAIITLSNAGVPREVLINDHLKDIKQLLEFYDEGNRGVYKAKEDTDVGSLGGPLTPDE